MIADAVETGLSLQDSDGTHHKDCSLGSSSEEALAWAAMGAGILTAIEPIMSLE